MFFFKCFVKNRISEKCIIKAVFYKSVYFKSVKFTQSGIKASQPQLQIGLRRIHENLGRVHFSKEL